MIYFIFTFFSSSLLLPCYQMSNVSSTMEANDNRPRQLIVLGCKRLLFAPMEQQRIQTAQGEKAHRHVFSLRCLYDDSKWSLQLLFRLRFLPFISTTIAQCCLGCFGAMWSYTEGIQLSIWTGPETIVAESAV